MKKIIMSLVLLALLAGCLGQAGTAQPTKEEVGRGLGNVTATPVKELISIGGDDNLSVVGISAVNQGGSWLFPMKDYEGQFQSAGLYSTAFIRLNGSQIRWLDGGESIWLTPMVRNGTGMLFNAIYSNDAVNCSKGNARILGRHYALSGLRNGSGFLMDDKWKVAVDSQGGCPSRIVIYMDGYFDKMKDGEQINLFRNDNTVLLSFEGLATSPSLRVIATRPVEVNATAKTESYARSWNMADARSGLNYSEKETLDENGLRLAFDPPLRVCPGNMCSSYQDHDSEATESHRLVIHAAGEWAVADMQKNANVEKLVIARETDHGVLGLHSCENNSDSWNVSIRAGNTSWFLRGFNSESRRLVLENPQGETLNLPVGADVKIGDDILHPWIFAPGYTLCASWADVSVFSEQLDLSDPAGQAALEWMDGSSANASLKSVFIPRSSPIFENLTGQSSN